MHLYVAIGFGAVAISSGFLVKIFWTAWGDRNLRDQKRYRTVTLGLMTGKLGLLMWAVNPLSWAFGFGWMPSWWMIFSSALVLAAAVTLIGSTAMGGSRRTVAWFIAACLVWTIFCIIWWEFL